MAKGRQSKGKRGAEGAKASGTVGVKKSSDVVFEQES